MALWCAHIQLSVVSNAEANADAQSCTSALELEATFPGCFVTMNLQVFFQGGNSACEALVLPPLMPFRKSDQCSDACIYLATLVSLRAVRRHASCAMHLSPLAHEILSKKAVCKPTYA